MYTVCILHIRGGVRSVRLVGAIAERSGAPSHTLYSNTGYTHIFAHNSIDEWGKRWEKGEAVREKRIKAFDTTSASGHVYFDCPVLWKRNLCPFYDASFLCIGVLQVAPCRPLRRRRRNIGNKSNKLLQSIKWP